MSSFFRTYFQPRHDNRFFLCCVKHSPLLWFIVALHVLWSLVLVVLPMTCVLDYESALLTAVFDGFVMPPVWVALSRRTGNNTLLFWPQWTALGLALSSIPLAFLLVSTLFICPYGILDGLLFWLLYPVCTVLFTASFSAKNVMLCLQFSYPGSFSHGH